MQKLKVLIADDREQMRWEIVRVLSSNCEILSAVADGVALLRAAKSLTPEVVVSDIQMPRLTGVEVMKILTAEGFEIPFVLLSTEAVSAEGRVREGALGVVHVIDLAYELLPAIRTAVRGQIYFSKTMRATLL